jgi:DNA-binding response OmpR family regulator
VNTENAPTILIIDNDEGMVAAIAERFGHLGYRCITAGTGAQGLALFFETHVDLIISDLNMPAGDGVVLAKSLRRRSLVPIIIVTGFHPEYRRELRGIANLTLMEKPFDSNNLIDLVESELILSGCTLPIG